MLVLVTGGSGFIGSHTMKALLAHGHRPRLLVRARDVLGAIVYPGGVVGPSQPRLDALGMTLRPAEESVADALRWLAGAGHLPRARAGRLARPPAHPTRSP